MWLSGAALACAAPLAAQTTATTPPGPGAVAQRQAAGDRTAREITITGCLSKGADDIYVLTNSRTAARIGASADSPTSPIPAGGAVPAATEPKGSGPTSRPPTWQLLGAHDLDPHVGHTIQVTGRALEEQSKNRDTQGETATGTTGTTLPSESRSSQPRVDVQSIKMIASRCS